MFLLLSLFLMLSTVQWWIKMLRACSVATMFSHSLFHFNHHTVSKSTTRCRGREWTKDFRRRMRGGAAVISGVGGGFLTLWVCRVGHRSRDRLRQWLVQRQIATGSGRISVSGRRSGCQSSERQLEAADGRRQRWQNKADERQSTERNLWRVKLIEIWRKQISDPWISLYMQFHSPDDSTEQSKN